jgi:hypothetical protein
MRSRAGSAARNADPRAYSYLTRCFTSSHNAFVLADRLPRRFVACLAVVGVLGLALLPSEHVHARDEHGHHTDVIHRHFESHHPVQSDGRIDQGDDDDEQYITAAFTAPESTLSVVVGALVVTDLPVPKPQQRSGWALPSPDASAHDPPRTSSQGLRAPPILLV